MDDGGEGGEGFREGGEGAGLGTGEADESGRHDCSVVDYEFLVVDLG